MAENRPDPYVKKDPGNIIRSGDWNELQVQAREEIRDQIREHRHTGGEEGNRISREAIEPGAIDGDRIDPSAEISVKALTVSGSLKLQGEVAVTKLSNDETLASGSDGVVPTEPAVKAYVDNTVAAAIPAGVILMWSGSLSNIPDGYALCDGRNGTPDLRDRFILSVAGDEDPGATGGPPNHQITLQHQQFPRHNHSGSTNLEEGGHSHSGSTNAGGAHTHRDEYRKTRGSWAVNGGQGHGVGGNDSRTTGGGEHGHSISLSGGVHMHTFTTSYDRDDKPQFPVDIIPKYYKLAFIIKL
jgi:hypothetical protein